MTNLLPQDYQKKIAKEYKYRKEVVALLGLAVTIFVSASFLVPSFVLSKVKLGEMTTRVEQVRKVNEGVAKKHSSSTILKDAEEKIRLLADTKGQESIDKLVGIITDEKSDTIKIKSISYAHAQGAPSTISVVGLAKDRESLTQFLKKMQSQSLFASVDLPVSNFAKGKDITFSMSISGTF